jgi:hypothetical protein
LHAIDAATRLTVDLRTGHYLVGELPPAPVELAARLLPFLKDQRSVWGTFTAW